MSPVTGDGQQLGLEYKARERGRLGVPSRCVVTDFRRVPMEIAMAAGVYRYIKAQEEAGSRPGSDGLELAEGCAAGAEGSEPGGVSCLGPASVLAASAAGTGGCRGQRRV